MVDLDSLIIAVFCLVDDTLRRVAPGRLRQRGPRPTLSDAEVLTIEVVGEYLGLDRETELFSYFRRHYPHFFPALRRVHRTTFVRQAANLWVVKERLWQRWLAAIPHEPDFALVDSFPLPVCQFARAYRCRRFGAGVGCGVQEPGLPGVANGVCCSDALHARVRRPRLAHRRAAPPRAAA